MNRAGPVPPSVTSAWSAPRSCTTSFVVLTFGQISARRAEKSFPAISMICSGDADVSALTSNVSDLGLESDIARLVLPLLCLAGRRLVTSPRACAEYGPHTKGRRHRILHP